VDSAFLVGILKLLRKPLLEKSAQTTRKLLGKPSKEDKQRLERYVRRLDERRVFYVDYNVEVVEACIGSLSSIKDHTEEVLAEVEHPGARAAIGAILDAIRMFLDKWSNFHTPRHHWDWDFERPGRRRTGGDLAHFFEDLGELRGVVRLMVVALRELHSNVDAPNLLSRSNANGTGGDLDL
jgi:hypothetical protein